MKCEEQFTPSSRGGKPPNSDDAGILPVVKRIKFKIDMADGSGEHIHKQSHHLRHISHSRNMVRSHTAASQFFGAYTDHRRL